MMKAKPVTEKKHEESPLPLRNSGKVRIRGARRKKEKGKIYGFRKVNCQ